ncbi:MAG: hypothetical protein IT320_08105 [Anaerolineae bacterium]|nr:hypothetical protein [Anaerolineae bacterium]
MALVTGFHLALRMLAGQGDAFSLIVGLVAGVILFVVFYRFLHDFAFWLR